jgi:hypothetical protein
VDALARELAEAREQQAATSEVLQIISSSPDVLEELWVRDVVDRAWDIARLQ